MKIIKKGTGYVYRFNCPKCGSKLEAEEYELDIRYNDKNCSSDVWFDCPACESEQVCIDIIETRKRSKYDENKD